MSPESPRIVVPSCQHPGAPSEVHRELLRFLDTTSQTSNEEPAEWIQHFAKMCQMTGLQIRLLDFHGWYLSLFFDKHGCAVSDIIGRIPNSSCEILALSLLNSHGVDDTALLLDLEMV